MALVAVLAAVLLGACASVPESPENAVIDFGTYSQTHSHLDDGRMCSRLRELTTDSQELRLLHRIVDFGSLEGEGLVSHHERSAVVRISIAFSDHGLEPRQFWRVALVKERRRWKVCRFVPERH